MRSSRESSVANGSGAGFAKRDAGLFDSFDAEGLFETGGGITF